MENEKQNPNDPINLPLYYIPHEANEDVNYMRHSREDWDISQLQGSIYFYQPRVKPDANGGTVILTETEKNSISRYLKKEFVDVRSDALKAFFNRLPDTENWSMSSDHLGMSIPFDKTGPFKGTVDSLSNTNYSVIIPTKECFEISLINQSIRLTDDRPPETNLTVDELIALKKREENERLRMIQKHFSTIYEHLMEQEEYRKHLASTISEDGGEDMIFSDTDEEQTEQGNEKECDVIDVKSDDEADVVVDNEIEILEDVDDLESSADSDSEEDKSDLEEPSKTRAKSPEIKFNKEMVNQIMGLPKVKECEVIEFMQNTGMVTGQHLMMQFGPKLVTNEQKQAFKEVICRLLKMVMISGQKYYQLKLS